MAKFLTTSGVTYEVEKIIEGAKKKLVLISPYVKISKMLLERLQNASDRGVQIILIYGKDELIKNEKIQLENIENLKLYFYQNLHAKCYFNEKTMVITSMNLYEFSEKNNREMGVLINKKEDEEMFNDTVIETHSIVKSSVEIINIKKLPKLFPLQSDHLNTIHKYFENNYYHCKVNSTPTYVYCADLLPFADVMIREGFEIRLFGYLYNEDVFVKKIKELKLFNLTFEYNIKVVDDMNRVKILFETSNANNLEMLLKDYKLIYTKIVEITKNLSSKTKNYF